MNTDGQVADLQRALVHVSELFRLAAARSVATKVEADAAGALQPADLERLLDDLVADPLGRAAYGLTERLASGAASSGPAGHAGVM